MPTTVQEFFSSSLEKVCSNLQEALLRVPEDKRNWSPMGDARTALNQVAECAILNGSTADLVKTKFFPKTFDFTEYKQRLDELARDWDTLKNLLEANTKKVAEAIRAVTDEELSATVEMPWGPMTIQEIISYPYWNMSYHEGQINYIASMLGCLS